MKQLTPYLIIVIDLLHITNDYLYFTTLILNQLLKAIKQKRASENF